MGRTARDPGVMPSMCLVPGLFGVSGMPGDCVCGCMWLLVGKGSKFPDSGIPGSFSSVSILYQLTHSRQCPACRHIH